MSVNEAGIVDNLVTQFSSALDCFRELVQNSIDAGSPLVEVWMEFERGEGHQGVISIHVDDMGEGMDSAIIDQQLTQLFSSTKEHDLTKIGKFGIGFVSVFAMQPKGVLVVTGRGGEYWEVFFHEDRSFTKTRLDVPCEGTQITLFLEGDFHRYKELAGGVRETLSFWCRHAEAEITFEDRSPADGSWSEPVLINEAFEVEGLCVTRAEHQGTEIVMAYTGAPSYGFYNRGLTLAHTSVGEDVLDGRASRYAHIGFKLKSRYLEHTLARETVVRDVNYEKAMALLGQAAGEMRQSLLAELEGVAALPRWGHEDVLRYAQLMGFLLREPWREIMRDVPERAILRMIDGRAVTPDAVLEAYSERGHALVAKAMTELGRALLDAGVPVVVGKVPKSAAGAVQGLDTVGLLVVRFLFFSLQGTWRERARSVTHAMKAFVGWESLDLRQRLQRTVAPPEEIYLPVRLDDAPPPAAQGIIDRASELLRASETDYQGIVTCRVGVPDASAPLFVVAPKLESVMMHPERTYRSRSWQAAVNRDHAQFKALQRLYTTHPKIAAYCLAKDLLLHEDRLLERDAALMQAAMSS